jgi:DNA-binding NtrC family response regulator
MFDLVRKIRHREDGTSKQRESSPGPESIDGAQIRVLAVTRNADDWRSLHQVAEKCGWMLFWAHSCDAAISTLSRYTIPVVICDRDLPGEDWRAMLKRISLFQQPTCILLASSVSDEYLWREVIQHQGYDVLPKPFQPDRLIRMVTSAWTWRGWQTRPPASSAAP